MKCLWLLSIALLVSANSNAGTIRKDSKDVDESGFTYEEIKLADQDPPATVNIVYKKYSVTHHPVILMLGSLNKQEVPFWSERLVSEGYMLAAFSVAYPPDPDPSRRPQWLHFDQRFAHGYTLHGQKSNNRHCQNY